MIQTNWLLATEKARRLSSNMEKCSFYFTSDLLTRKSALTAFVLVGTERDGLLSVITMHIESQSPSITCPCKSLAHFLPLRSLDRKSTRLNSSHANISYAVLCLKKKTTKEQKKKKQYHTTKTTSLKHYLPSALLVY